MQASPPSRTIYLHIGTEKTGTTTLQTLAATNRNLLASHGLCYPRVPGETNHIGLAVFALDGATRVALHTALKLQGDAAVADYVANFLSRLHAELDASQQDKVLLSNEHLSSRIRKSANVARLVKGLRSMSKAIKIVVYIRPQYELLLSAYSTAIKSGSTRPISLDKSGEEHFFNYDKMLALWEDEVGIENINVRLFSSERFIGGSLTADFFDALGMEVPAQLVVPTNRNRTLDAETVEFLRLANEHLPRLIDGAINRDRMGMLVLLEKMSNGPRIAVPSFDLARIDGIFADSNGRVASRYFPDQSGQLFSPFKDRGNDSAASLTVERAVEIGIALWKERDMANEGKKARRLAARQSAH